MNANDLKERIEVWKYIPYDNSGGTPMEPLQLWRKKFAGVKFTGGGTNYEALGNQPYATATFTIRYDKQVDYKCQIKFEGTFYKITSIDVVEREAWMKIQTTVFNQTF